MIDGLTLTFSGEEIRTLLEQQMARHQERADWWTSETGRTPEDQTEDAPLLPEHMCEHEAERHAWRARVLAFIRDHLEPSETYRLGAADLAYGELLPEKPGSVEQDEYEERSRVGFSLERLVKSVDGLGGLAYALHRRSESDPSDVPTMNEVVVDETNEFRTTRIDVEGGPEIIKIERV
jgi:hypothetical protein